MIRKIALFVVVGLLFAGCSTMSVKTDYDPGTDFTGLKTYQWVTMKGGDDVLAKAPLVQKRAMTALDKALAAKGYQKMGSGTPDFYVMVHAGVKDKINVSDYGYNYGPYWRRGAYGGGGSIDVTYYTEGTVFVDIIRKPGESFELIWRGAATGVVNPPDDPQAAQEKADKAAVKILENFPPTNK